MSKKLDEILKKIKQIESSSMRDLFKGLANDGKDLDNILGLVNNTLEQQSKGLEDVAGRYRDIVDLNSKQAEKSQQILSTTNDLVSISRSLSNIKKGESSTSKQELKSLASQIQSKKSILVLQQGIVGSSSEQGKIISSVLKSLDDELSQLKAVQENFSAVNKELGFGPAILGGMDKALSKLCRAQGIYSHHVTQWKLDFISGKPTKNKTVSLTEIKTLKDENKILKKELNRKDKALAETAALLVLQKKVHDIWGSDEDSLR